MNPRPNVGWGLTLGSVFGFVIIVATLHFLQPGYDPTHQLMSELALGPHGWAMFIAFVCLAVAAYGTQSLVAKLGGSAFLQIIFLTAAAFFLAAGIFPLGRASEAHVFAISAAFVSSVLGMLLVPSLAPQIREHVPRALCWGLAAGVAVSVALSGGVVPLGVGQRMAATWLLLWFGIVGWRLRRA